MAASRMMITASGILAGALLAALTGASSGDESIDEGRAFVTDNCARCHAVDAEGTSPLGEAPPLRTLHDNYPVENLAEAFAEGIVTGHADMPQFVLTPDEIGAVIAYLKSLE